MAKQLDMLANFVSRFILLGLLGAMVALLFVSSWSPQSPIQAQGLDADGDGVIDDSPLEQRSDIPESRSSGPGSGNLLGVSWDWTNSPVYTIDAANGTGALVGLSGFAKLNSLALNNSGILFSAEDTSTPDDENIEQHLLMIDPDPVMTLPISLSCSLKVIM